MLAESLCFTKGTVNSYYSLCQNKINGTQLSMSVRELTLLLHPTSAVGEIVLASCVCESVSVCVCCHSPGQMDRHTDLKFIM